MEKGGPSREPMKQPHYIRLHVGEEKVVEHKYVLFPPDIFYVDWAPRQLI